MSGIAGIARHSASGVGLEVLGRMAAAIKHRGPDGYGFYSSPHVGFAHVRLSTLDLTGGMQPLANEDGRVIVTYDGEIYNHRELRHQLEQRGHYFRSRCDTEILVGSASGAAGRAFEDGRRLAIASSDQPRCHAPCKRPTDAAAERICVSQRSGG